MIVAFNSGENQEGNRKWATQLQNWNTYSNTFEWNQSIYLYIYCSFSTGSFRDTQQLSSLPNEKLKKRNAILYITWMKTLSNKNCDNVYITMT